MAEDQQAFHRTDAIMFLVTALLVCGAMVFVLVSGSTAPNGKN
jgi:hypothetical protein